MQWKLNQQIVTCVHVRVSSLSVTVPVTFWSPRVLSIWLALVTSRSGRARRATSCAKRRLLSLRPWRKRLLLGWWLGGFCKVFGCTIVECSYPDRIHAHRNRCKIEMLFQIWQTPCCGHCGLQVFDTSSSVLILWLYFILNKPRLQDGSEAKWIWRRAQKEACQDRRGLSRLASETCEPKSWEVQSFWKSVSVRVIRNCVGEDI